MDILTEHRDGEITVFTNNSTPEIHLTTRRAEAKEEVAENMGAVTIVAENMEEVKGAAKYAQTFDDVLLNLPTIIKAMPAAETAVQAKDDAISAKESAQESAQKAESAVARAEEVTAEQVELAKGYAEQAKTEVSKVSSAFKIVGTVPTVEDLPVKAEVGNIYLVGDNSVINKPEYVWTSGGTWEKFGDTVDLSAYQTKEEAETALAEKQDTLTAGEGIKIEGNVISTEGGKLPDNVYTEENLIAGENVTFDKKSGADDNTVGLFHFDGNAKDAVSGNELSESPVIATEGKFGTGCLKTRENWFNSVSFAKSIDPKTTPFTLEFWHKQIKGTTAGTWGDETTIVLAPTAPNNTASKSQWVGLFMLPDGTNNKIQLQIGDSRLGEFRTNNYTTLGEYNHYALTWDPSTQYFKLYMNGTYVDQYQYYYYNSLPVLGGIGMFKYTTGTDDNTVAQAYIDELRFSDTVRYTGSFTVATEAFPSDKLKTVVNVNVPEGGFNKDNLLGGKDIEIIPEPVEGGIDEHTVACWHFDEDKLDVVGGEEWKANYSNITNAYSKFGGKSIYANKYAFSTGISASGLSGWTIDGWILFTGTENTQFATGSYVSNYISFTGLRADISRTRIILGQYRGTIDKTFTFDTSLSTNTWYHLAVQLKDGKFQAFINGKKVAEIDWTTAVTTNFGFYQGGYLDEVRISNIARYNGDFTPPTQAYRLAVPTGRYQINYTANYDYVVETYNDGTNWYRVYKSRWVEQGGIISGLTAAEAKVVTFPKPFIDEKYSVFWQYAVVVNGYIPRVTERTSTSFTMQSDYFATTYPVGDRIWRAEGQGA